jgi:hypothetical protein
MEGYKEASILYKKDRISKADYNEMIKFRGEFTAYHFIVTARGMEGIQDMMAMSQQTDHENAS